MTLRDKWPVCVILGTLVGSLWMADIEGWTSTLLTPVFAISRCQWVPFLCPTRSYWPPLLAEEIGLSLSHLEPEIISPKVGLIVHKNLSFDHFEAFCTNFLLDFRFCWPPFLVLRSFWPLIFTKPQIPMGPFFHHVLDPPLPKIWWSTPPGAWYI